MEEIPQIPRLPHTPGVVLYAPLGDTPVDPDVVLFAGRPWANCAPAGGCPACGPRDAGSAPGPPDLYGPSCRACPRRRREHRLYRQSRLHRPRGGRALCGGSGKDLVRIADEVETIAAANAKLSEYHRGRRQGLATE